MKQPEINKFLAKLLGQGLVYAPVRKGPVVLVEQVDSIDRIDWSGDIPITTFKSVFLPPKEVLFDNNKAEFADKIKKFAWGMNVLDLQAFSLFEQVFEKDIYYQKRRQNIFIIGFTNGIEDDFRKYKVFHQKYEENVLEHLIFDVFIERQKNGNMIVFSGSEKGQQLLEQNGIKDYENIEFAGLVPEQGINPIITRNRQAVELGRDNPIWDELAEICLACGKCSIHCPTCFCFDEKDQAEFDSVKKVRQWGSCFYPEFSKTAGGNKDLDSVKKKLYFWYEHKFVRIPDEFSYYGCVSCMRCFKVCPVEINIAKNLQALNK
ncbi:4Fe-4S dicluster domain-containing protein [Candidatus Kuenenbacteria bacterium]|nr:4Fe-4S dicluster domain-containing protein [Candidatus Kuenenbacteria bacterium]